LDEAFDIIAEIIVDEIAMPILPNINATAKSAKFFIVKDSNSKTNKIVIAKFIKKTEAG
jgi:hypothetical protein